MCYRWHQNKEQSSSFPGLEKARAFEMSLLRRKSVLRHLGEKSQNTATMAASSHENALPPFGTARLPFALQGSDRLKSIYSCVISKYWKGGRTPMVEGTLSHNPS